jgi:hypothetical protein
MKAIRSLSWLKANIFSRETAERWMISFVMILGLVHGMLYLILMPPWQHYDEPSHFEYAWLIASRFSLPEYPDFDPAERRVIAESMIEHGFFKGMDYLPNLDALEEPAWIGVNLTGALPLYHIIIAIPIRILFNTNVDTQLYAARVVSMVMYLMTLWLAYKLVSEFVPQGHALRWVVPGAMALQPGFTELMSAVNNDVGATLAFSLFLYASARLIQQGLSWRRAAFLLLCIVLCVLTKNTVLVALPLGLLALFFALHRWRGWKWVGFTLFGGTLVLMVAVFSWGDASLWYRDSLQAAPTHGKVDNAPLGQASVILEAMPGGENASRVYQPLPTSLVEKLRGKTVTIGAWIWASEPIQVRPAIISQTLLGAGPNKVEVGFQPVFIASRVEIPADAERLWVILRAPALSEVVEPVSVYYDGVILLEGEWPLDSPPDFNGVDANEGTWAGMDFHNLVRNASAEKTWPYVRPWLETLAQRFPWAAHLSPTGLVNASLDLQNSTPLFRATISRLWQTFWGFFGWGHVNLPTEAYRFIKWLTLLSLAMAPFGLWNVSRMKSRTWALALAFLGLALMAIWGIVFMRGLPSLFGEVYLPTARYAYPVIIPTMFLISAGWCAGLPRLKWQMVLTGLFFTMLLALDILSLITIIRYYCGR